MQEQRKKALVLLNISAGTGRNSEYTLKISRKLAENGYEPVIYPIIPGTDLVAETLIPEYIGKTDLILCCGGDGTLNHVTETVMSVQNKPCLAYIPSGSTNDFARGIGIPADFEQALEVAVNGRPFKYDVGSLNGTYFNYVAAFGAFSAVSYATSQEMKNVLGHAAYIINAVGDLYQQINYKCHLKIELEDEVLEDDYVFGAVCNAVSIGGFKMFDDSICLDDGKMELLLIKAPKTPADLQGILLALSKGGLSHPSITIRQITKARMHADSGTAWSLDGEFGGTHDEINIEVIKNAIEINIGG
ncbi:MAG: YegS/Rv2252/BmrU family lipid kinase [Lachnospiraceae bacterium]|nr:YegS/Rv2252/BmrU family lipid kinase [Lachnospiraceae bacterium]